MMKGKHRIQQHNSSGPMADIAFLILIFFMVTTTIAEEKGLDLLLPEIIDEQQPALIGERNIFKIQVNSDDQIMVEGKLRKSIVDLRNEIKIFILNNGRDKALSDSPQKAVVSIKTNRGTSQGTFIQILDEAKAAYYSIYAEKAGVSPSTYRDLSMFDANEKIIYMEGKKDIPMRISIAEPE